MATRIEVTAEDIKNGVEGDCGYCPIALAGSRALGMRVEAVPTALLNRETGKLVAELPLEARVWMRRFDRMVGVSPFTFEV